MLSRVIGAEFREVADREWDGKPAKAVVAARVYDTDPDDLWDALTNAERLPRWVAPISGELKLGGRYQLQGTAAEQQNEEHQRRATQQPRRGVRKKSVHHARSTGRRAGLVAPGAQRWRWSLAVHPHQVHARFPRRYCARWRARRDGPCALQVR